MYKLDNKLASHLAVKQGVYYFVRRVPSDLVGYYRSAMKLIQICELFFSGEELS